MPSFVMNRIKLTVPREVSSPKVFAKMREGTFEVHEARMAMRRIRPGDRVLEIGSGVGYVTSLCARKAGAENVVAVEANPDLHPIIRANLAQNGFEGVTLIHGAVAGQTTEQVVTFNVGPAFWGSSLTETRSNVARRITVPLLNVHDLLAEHRPTVVLMDVEGAEAQMFDRPWPAHVHTVGMELHPALYEEGTIGRIFGCLAQTGLAYDPGISHRDVVCLSRGKGW
ncbi:MAG: FkbM family methyltransferase [Shimia sp.]